MLQLQKSAWNFHGVLSALCAQKALGRQAKHKPILGNLVCGATFTAASDCLTAESISYVQNDH